MDKTVVNKVTEDFRILPPDGFDPESYEKFSGSFYDEFFTRAVDSVGLNFEWLVNHSTKEKLTVGEAIEASERSAKIFKKAGISKSDIVHVLFENGNTAIISVIFGCWMIGAVPALADPTHGLAVLQGQVRTSHIILGIEVSVLSDDQICIVVVSDN